MSDQYNDARARIDEQKRVREDQKRKYDVERESATDAVATYVRAQIVSATSEQFANDIRMFVDVNRRANKNYQTAEIRVDYAENRVSDESIPMKWSWSFRVNSSGKAVRGTSSWSGLNATTADHIAQLEQSINALKALSNLDDERLVKLVFQNAPAYDEYVTQQVDRLDETEYSYKKLDALAGEDVFLASDKNWYGEYYYKIVKDTGKQYAVEHWYLAYPKRNIGNEESTFRLLETRRFRKDKLYEEVNHPIVPVTREQIQAIMDEKNNEFEARKRDE